MASGFSGYKYFLFLNIMRPDTTERVTSTTEDLWTVVENATSIMEEPLMGFSAVTRNDYHDYTVPFGEGWGSMMEITANNPASVVPALTLRDVFMLMTTYPGMVLVGTMTTGGNITNNWQGITVL
jgi:hypothetical protein